MSDTVSVSFENDDDDVIYGYVESEMVPTGMDERNDRILYCRRWFAYTVISEPKRVGKTEVGYSTKQEAIDEFHKRAEEELFQSAR